jgi:hypothetical protein
VTSLTSAIAVVRAARITVVTTNVGVLVLPVGRGNDRWMRR